MNERGEGSLEEKKTEIDGGEGRGMNLPNGMLHYFPKGLYQNCFNLLIFKFLNYFLFYCYFQTFWPCYMAYGI